MEVEKTEFVEYPNSPKEISIKNGKRRIEIKGLLNIYTSVGCFETEIEEILTEK